MMTRWTHVTIPVSDLDRSIRFYTSYCGLHIVRDRRGEGGSTVWLGIPPNSGNPSFVLVLAKGEINFQLNHLGFQCDSRENVDQITLQAKSENKLLEGPIDSGGSIGYWVQIRDPDGHRVEFTHGQPLSGLM